MNSKAIGERSEAMVIAALLRAGKVVLQPFGDNQRYDLVIDETGKFTRIQVKTGRLKGGTVYADTCSSYVHRGGGKRGYAGEADVFAIYSPDLDKIFMIPVENVSLSCVTLRLEPPPSGRMNKVKMAKDFEFNSWVAQR